MEKEYVWTEEYSVRNQMLDEQHQTFISIANDLIKLSKSDVPNIATLFEKATWLGDYAMYHLSTEEQLFKEYGYPETEEHTAAHDAFRNEAERLINMIRDGSGNANAETKRAAEFCNNWLLNHIMKVDKRYSQFFIEKGLK